jgi:hypothetical protein
MLPIADALIALARSRWWIASFGVLAAISVHNGLVYNVHLNKAQESLLGSTISGWLFPVLLPDFETGRALHQPLTPVWIAVAAGLLCVPLVAARTLRQSPAPRAQWSPAAVVLIVLLLFASLSSAAGAVSGVRFNPAFMMHPGDARDRLIHFELTEHPAVRWSSINERVDLKTYFPNPDGTSTTLTVRPERPSARDAVDIAIEIRRPGNRPGWGTARVDFGDGSPAMSLSVEDTARIQHVYGQPGEYQVQATIELWGLPSRTISETLRVDQE